MFPLIAILGRFVIARSLIQENRLIDAVESSLDTLSKLGEQPLRDLGDASLYSDILAMNATLRNISDDEILNMQEVNAKKVLTTMKIYGKYGLCIVLGCVHANGFSFENQLMMFVKCLICLLHGHKFHTSITSANPLSLCAALVTFTWNQICIFA